jgi:hypothetical protein
VCAGGDTILRMRFLMLLASSRDQRQLEFLPATIKIPGNGSA